MDQLQWTGGDFRKGKEGGKLTKANEWINWPPNWMTRCRACCQYFCHRSSVLPCGLSSHQKVFVGRRRKEWEKSTRIFLLLTYPHFSSSKRQSVWPGSFRHLLRLLIPSGILLIHVFNPFLLPLINIADLFPSSRFAEIVCFVGGEELLSRC